MSPTTTRRPVTTHAASLARWRAHQAAGADRGILANNLSLKGDVRAEGGKLHLLELTLTLHPHPNPNPSPNPNPNQASSTCSS